MEIWILCYALHFLMLRDLLFPLKKGYGNESCILLNCGLTSIKVLIVFFYFLVFLLTKVLMLKEPGESLFDF